MSPLAATLGARITEKTPLIANDTKATPEADELEAAGRRLLRQQFM